MAIGDVIGSHPGPWWFDKDGNDTKSDEQFTTEQAAYDAGIDAKEAAKKAANAAAVTKAKEEGPDLATRQAHADWLSRGGRG